MTSLVSVNPRATKPRIESITIRIPLNTVFALKAVLRNVGGPVKTSRRALCDTVLSVLRDATKDETSPSDSDLSGNIRFEPRD